MARMKEIMVFFDLMGTLVDTKTDRAAHEALMKSLCDRYDFKEDIVSLTNEYDDIAAGAIKDDDLKWKIQRNVIRQAFRKILSERNLEFNDDDFRWFYHEYLEKHRNYVRLYPGAVDMLSELANMEIKMGIISDADSFYLDFQIDALDIKKFFDYVVASEDVAFKKPHPKIFEKALEVSGFESSQCIMVGDSIEKDMMGAKMVGMHTILFDPMRKVEDVRYTDFIITDLRRVPPIVKEYSTSFI